MHDGERYVITHLAGLEHVLAKNEETGKIKELPLKEITPVSEKTSEGSNLAGAELSLISTEDWNEADVWYERLIPLIESTQITREMVDKVAEVAGVHRTTVYRKLNIYEAMGKVSSLVKEKPGRKEGQNGFPEEVEMLIQSTIDNFHFNKEKKKRKKKETCEEIKKKLAAAKLPVPSEKTIYNRINAAINSQNKKDSKSSSYIDDPSIPDKLTGDDYPLALVQIDHTEVDIEVVDEEFRESIGRPWITVVIDIFSRMILGFYLSLAPPGDISVGLCLAHAISTKEKWLAKFNITTPYPSWGIMDIVHADNAGEFHSNMLKRACKEYGIDLEWRPIKKPQYGSHIERLLGILLNEVHKLPGTTFSNIDEKGDYDSEKYAQLTLSELEEWYALFITGVYHQRFHPALNTTPIKQYERGILGNKDTPGRGLPKGVESEDRLRLDLMPGFTRTIQDYGIKIDHIRYNSGVLSRFKHDRDPNNPKRKIKFIFKRDPRDISVVYFYDPELKEYFRVPYRDTSFPSISIWEHRKILRHLKALGEKDVDEKLIFETNEKMHEVRERAAEKTKTARRDMERRRHHQQITPPKTADNLYNVSDKAIESIDEESYDEIEIPPYDEIEIYD